MSVSRDMLVSELKELARLTAFERAVATVRRAQAASASVAEELAANAAKSGERLTLLAQAVRGVGGTPDVVGPVLGRLAALVQTQVNQVQTLQGALLGDLALEHQLRDRARYARTLAMSLGESSVIPVLDRLDAAHSETIEWLERRLTEVARTGSSALKATPVQVAVGSLWRVAGAPFTLATEGVNRAGALVRKVSRRTPATLSQVESAVGSAAGTVGEAADRVAGTAGEVADRVADRAGEAADRVAGTAGEAADRVADTAGEVADRVADRVTSAADTATDSLSSGASAAADSAAQAADAGTSNVEAAADTPERAADRAAQATSEVLEATGGDDVADEKAPFAGYERLTGDSIMRHVEDTEDVDELRTLLAFEQAHKARKGVLKAAQERLSTLAG